MNDLCQPGFTITPAMREKVFGGMLLFSRSRFPPSVQPVWSNSEPTWWENVRRKTGTQEAA